MRPKDYGLIFYQGLRPLYFTSFRIVKEEQTEHIEAELAIGGTIMVNPYFSKRLNRIVEAKEAIYRYPKLLTGEK